MQGGVASGFNHVTHTFEPRLFAIKGKRRAVVKQLPKVSWSAMNNGDAFILQFKEVIFIWEGRTANNLEKLQAAKARGSFGLETDVRKFTPYVNV